MTTRTRTARLLVRTALLGAIITAGVGLTSTPAFATYPNAACRGALAEEASAHANYLEAVRTNNSSGQIYWQNQEQIYHSAAELFC
jgi:hypothetical protein